MFSDKGQVQSDTMTGQEAECAPGDHECINESRFRKIEKKLDQVASDQKYALKRLTKCLRKGDKRMERIEKGLEIRGIINGQTQEKVDGVEEDLENKEKSLKDDIRELRNIIIIFIIAMITVMSIFIGLLTWMLRGI